jgi:hypothetical protein
MYDQNDVNTSVTWHSIVKTYFNSFVYYHNTSLIIAAKIG